MAVKIENIEKAIEIIHEFRIPPKSTFDDLKLEIFEALSQDKVLIECTIGSAEFMIDAVFPDDYNDGGKFDTWLCMQNIILKNISIPLIRRASEALQEVGEYFRALVFLSEYDIDETEI